MLYQFSGKFVGVLMFLLTVLAGGAFFCAVYVEVDSYRAPFLLVGWAFLAGAMYTGWHLVGTLASHNRSVPCSGLLVLCFALFLFSSSKYVLFLGGGGRVACDLVAATSFGILIADYWFLRRAASMQQSEKLSR